MIVLDELKNIETKYDITIIYAWLGGSRHFNIFTVDSDYDVFYIYEGEKGSYNDIIVDYSFRGRLHSDFMRHLIAGKSYYVRDALRPDVVYVPNKKFTEEYLNDLVPQVDINIALLSIKKGIKQMCVTSLPSSTKMYKRMLRYAMNYLWIQENQSLSYPMDVRILIEYFNDRPWYDIAKYLLANLDMLDLPRSPDLMLLFNNIAEVF